MGLLLASAVGPWIVIAAVLLVGVGLWFVGRRGAGVFRWIARTLSVVLVVLGLAMTVGAGAMEVSAAKIAAARPAAGKFVDVGGYRVFVLCEGPRTPDTVLWLSGGYAAGAFMTPLHERMKAERRSCLIDRPGTGWADRGPMPRSVSQILREIHDGLAGAGETGPLIVAGHSMGGLYAANYADAYPAQVRAIVLLDPTPALWFTEQVQLMGCGEPAPADFRVWATAYGLGLIPALNPLFGPQTARDRAAVGAVWPALAAMESRPQSLVAGGAAGQYVCTHGISLVRTPGALGDLPVLKIVQAVPADPLKYVPPGLDAREQRNWLRMRESWNQEHVSYTRRGTLLYAPKGFDHGFPIVEADWTMRQIRPFLTALDAPAARP